MKRILLLLFATTSQSSEISLLQKIINQKNEFENCMFANMYWNGIPRSACRKQYQELLSMIQTYNTSDQNRLIVINPKYAELPKQNFNEKEPSSIHVISAEMLVIEKD